MPDGSLNPAASILPGYIGDLDWYDQVIKNGYRAEYLLSGSGSSDRSDYYFSLGYLDENGYVKITISLVSPAVPLSTSVRPNGSKAD